MARPFIERLGRISRLLSSCSIMWDVLPGVMDAWNGDTMKRHSSAFETRDPLAMPTRDLSGTAILLLNMGGPDTLEDVQPFLYRLFSDPDIIRLPLSMIFQSRWRSGFLPVA